MRYLNVAVTILIMAIVIAFTVQPVAQAAQGLDEWAVEDERGDSSTGCLTVYYEVVGWDDFYREELALMFFFFRFYEKKTREWHIVSGVADTTVLLRRGAAMGQHRTKLQEFLDGPVLSALCDTCGYTSIHLVKVENDYHNLGRAMPPFVVSADIEIVAK